MISNNKSTRSKKFVTLGKGLCLSGLLSTTAWADVTIEGTHSPGFGGGVERQRIYLRDEQMRIDQLAQDGNGPDRVASSLLIRFSGQPAGVMYLDHEAQTVQVLSTLPAASSANPAAIPTAIPVTLIRRDETWEIMGQTAQRYDFSFSGNVDPLAVLGDQLPPGMAGMVAIKLSVNGTTWVVPGMDGAEELAGFFATLASKQLAVGLIGQTVSGQPGSVVSPGLSRALTEVMMQITREGFPLVVETRSEMKVDMQGTVADMAQAMLQGMGLTTPQSTESIVTRVSTSAVAPALFYSGGKPPGYTLTNP